MVTETMRRMVRARMGLRLAAAAVILGTLVSVAGCGGATGSGGAGGTSGSGGATSSAGGGGGPGAAKAKAKIVLAAYSPPFHEQFVKAVVEPFMQKNPDVEVVYQDVENSAKLLATLRAQKDDPQIDVALMDSSIAAIGNQEGIFQRLDPKLVPNVADLYPEAKTPDNFGPGVTFDNLVILYNKSKVGTPITSWRDLWRPELKGRLWLPNPPDIQALSLIVLAANMNGGSAKNVDPAFAELKKLRDNVALWGPNATQVQQGLVQGEVWAGVFWNARSQLFKATGAPVEVALPKEGSVFQINTLNLVNKTKQPEAAQRFINYAISPEAQAAFSSAMFYAPVNSKTKLTPDVLNRTASGPEQRAKIITLDWPYIVTVRDGWAERWKKELIAR